MIWYKKWYDIRNDTTALLITVSTCIVLIDDIFIE